MFSILPQNRRWYFLTKLYLTYFFSALLVLSLAKDLINERLSSTFQVCSKIIITVQIEKQRAVSLFVAYYLPHNAETQNSAKNSHKRVTVRDDLKFQVGVVSGQSQLS